MSISDICKTRVVTSDKDAPLVDVARLMRDHQVGCVVVTEQVKEKLIPIGLITDRDLALEIVAIEADPKKLRARDMVIHNAVVAQETDGILESLRRMRSHGVRRLPVVNHDGILIGIVSADDMIELIAKELGELAKMIAVEQRNENNIIRMSRIAGSGFSGLIPI